MLTGGTEPTYVLEGREALTPVFADLNRYDVTTHFNGQSTVATKTRAALTFFKGASLKDRSGLFNSSLEGNTRCAIDFHEDDEIDERAFVALIRAAVSLNESSSR